MKPDDYRNDGFGGKWGVRYVEPEAQSYTVIDVLPFLRGRPWDEIALAYVHALRPSTIRVNNTDCWKLDARNWRVSVLLAADDRTIRRITQEVAVGLPDGISCGHDLQCALAADVSYDELEQRQVEQIYDLLEHGDIAGAVRVLRSAKR